MSTDKERIQKLEDELNYLQSELKTCNEARRQVIGSHEGGIGQYRKWAPDCSNLEQQVPAVSTELEKARKGEAPSPTFTLPSSHLEPPPYLNKASADLYKKIAAKAGAAGQAPYWISDWILEGRGPQLETRVKSDINQEITQFLKDNASKLYDFEIEYWKRVQEASKVP